MSDGPIYRSPGDVAEAVAQHRIDVGGAIINGSSIRARLTAETQARIDAIIRRESELGAFALEDVRELGRWTI